MAIIAARVASQLERRTEPLAAINEKRATDANGLFGKVELQK